MQPTGSIPAIGALFWGRRSVFLSGQIRVVASAVAITLGIGAYVSLSYLLGSTLSLVILALLVAIPVSASKTVTACGLNVLHTVARHEFPSSGQPGFAILYAITATVTAGSIGWLLSIAGETLTRGQWLVLAVPTFMLAGFREFGGPAVPVLTSSWQVPAHWVRGRLTGAIVFGFFLGSGIATWMPSASFYALAVLSFLLPAPTGVIVMGGYGLVRAAPAIVVALTACSSEDIRRHSLQLYLAGRATSGLMSFAMAAAVAAMYFLTPGLPQ